MRITVLAVGRLKDAAERDLVTRYLDRARAASRQLGFSGPDIGEVGESRAGRATDRKAEEAAGLRARAGEGFIVALDERGPYPTSEEFAQRLAACRDEGRRAMVFLIGGPDGLDPALTASAGWRVGFGRMTLPHQIVRVLLTEQIYRAMTILSGHPYHRT